jgi:hypothetical protein
MITEKELAMIVAIAESNYHDDIDEDTWSWGVCGYRSKSAVLGSLVKKGLASSCDFGGDPDENTCRLTKEGIATYLAVRPDSSHSKAYFKKHPEESCDERP